MVRLKKKIMEVEKEKLILFVIGTKSMVKDMNTTKDGVIMPLGVP